MIKYIELTKDTLLYMEWKPVAKGVFLLWIIPTVAIIADKDDWYITISWICLHIYLRKMLKFRK